MKVASAAALIAAAAANASAQSVKFSNLPFTGYDGTADCEEDMEFLTGKALGISVPKDSNVPITVCEETEYTFDDQTFVAYTGMTIYCEHVAIGKDYYSCDEDCKKCDEMPFQYGIQRWDDVDGTDDCYANTATQSIETASEEGMDDGVSNIAGAETAVITSSWHFDDDANQDDVKEWMKFAKDNTCIGAGQPEIDDKECLPYKDLICSLLDEQTNYTLSTSCGIFKELGSEAPFNSTLFVPTDGAFERLDELAKKSDEDKLSDDKMLDIVMYHGTNATVLYDDLICTEKIEMWTGMNSRTRCEKTEDGNILKFQKGGGNRENDNLPFIAIADLLACNGVVVHIVTEVMLPNWIDKIERL